MSKTFHYDNTLGFVRRTLCYDNTLGFVPLDDTNISNALNALEQENKDGKEEVTDRIKTITIPLNPKDSYEFPSRICLVCEKLEREEAKVANAGIPWLCDRCKNTLLKLIMENENG